MLSGVLQLVLAVLFDLSVWSCVRWFRFGGDGFNGVRDIVLLLYRAALHGAILGQGSLLRA